MRDPIGAVPNVGFVDLGVMGRRMAVNLLGAVFGQCGRNPDPAPIGKLAALGAVAAGSRAAAA